jgi:large subunit ribosomal protein L21
MYAVIKTGGKQHKVKAGVEIEVEKLVVGAEAAKAVVTAKPLGEKKGDKVKVFKYRPKSGYARKSGHRQLLTMLEITDVKLPAGRTTSKKMDEDKDDADATASSE